MTSLNQYACAIQSKCYFLEYVHPDLLFVNKLVFMDHVFISWALLIVAISRIYSTSRTSTYSDNRWMPYHELDVNIIYEHSRRIILSDGLLIYSVLVLFCVSMDIFGYRIRVR